MPTPQPAIFAEGTPFHWFLHFALADGADLGDVRRSLRAIRRDTAARSRDVAPLHLVVGFGDRLLPRLAPDDAPAGLHAFRAVEGKGGRRAVATQEDVFLWFHGARHDLNFDAALGAVRAFDGTLDPILS